MIVESTKYIISLLSVFIFFIIYLSISLIILKDTYNNSQNIWLYSLIYTLIFPLKIYLSKEYIIEQNNNNSVVIKKFIAFRINRELNNNNLIYFIFIYLCEIILFIWGCIVLSIYSNKKYDDIYILTLFNIIIGGLITFYLSFTIGRLIINKNKNLLDKENNIVDKLVKEQYLEINNKIEIAERSLYGTGHKITEI